MQHIQCNLDHALKVGNRALSTNTDGNTHENCVLQLQPQNRFMNQQESIIYS
jgi:hypothetical protein